LPKKIEEYLEKNYRNFDYQRGIVFYQNDKIVGYLLVIRHKEKILCLNFDANGTFLKSDECGESKDGQRLQLIDSNSLPDAIKKEILKRHTENYKILFAAFMSKGNRRVFLVTVLKDNDSFAYEFEESGKVISEKKIPMPQLPNLQVQEKQFESKDLPIKIKEYLDKNFVGWQFVKGLELLINSKLDRYLVVIKFGNDYYYVSFDPSGTFLGVRKG
ncbi:MAG: hypothetical protein MUF45_03555, partial [Spirosomaceae bacterium]|nr:hypothetical protein [Spirosomataceae bacterium]